MKGKITLITPPDIFENESYSILFMNLSDQDQEATSQWLARQNIDENINIYFYDNETDIAWILHAFAHCEYKLINLDNSNEIITRLASYLLSKKNSFYKTNDENLSALYQYINRNCITNIENFLERALNDKIKSGT